MKMRYRIQVNKDILTGTNIKAKIIRLYEQVQQENAQMIAELDRLFNDEKLG